MIGEKAIVVELDNQDGYAEVITVDDLYEILDKIQVELVSLFEGNEEIVEEIKEYFRGVK